MTPSKFQQEGDVWRLKKFKARAALPPSTMRGSDWAKEPSSHYQMKIHRSTVLEWYVECQARGMVEIAGVVEIDPARRNGVPVLWATRFTVAQLLAELAETDGVDEVAERFDLDAKMIRAFLDGLSLVMQRPCFKE